MIFDVFRRKLKVWRYSAGTYVDGPWVDGSLLSTFCIKASTQGVDNEILQTFPEGDRTKKSYLLYTDTKLQTAIEGKNATEPDIVEIYDEKYRVVRVTVNQNITGYATAHYQVVVMESNVDAN